MKHVDGPEQDRVENEVRQAEQTSTGIATDSTTPTVLIAASPPRRTRPRAGRPHGGQRSEHDDVAVPPSPLAIAISDARMTTYPVAMIR